MNTFCGWLCLFGVLVQVHDNLCVLCMRIYYNIVLAKIAIYNLNESYRIARYAIWKA